MAAVDDGLRVVSRDGGAIPFGYVVTETGVITITAAHATFNGAGASGAYLPCLSVYAQNGVLLGRYFPDTGAVAAGSDADVSYGPFLGGGSGGGTVVATADYATAQRDITTALFADGFANSYPADYFDIGNTAMFADDGTGKLNVLQAGLYEITMVVQMYSATIPATAHPTMNQQFDNAGFPNDHTLNDPGTQAGSLGVTIAGTSFWNVNQTSWLDLNTAPCAMWFAVTGGGAVHTNFDDAQASIRVVRLTEASPSGVS